MKRPLCFAAAAMLLCLSGCLFATDSKVTYEGRYVSPDQMLQLEPGVGEDEVVLLLGTPSNKSDLGDGKVLWSWRYTRHDMSSNHVFLLLSSKREETSEGTVYVRFENGKVAEVWR